MFVFNKKISKLYNKEGINIINANTTGNKTVQQNDINWSKRILGKEALTHININTIKDIFKPKNILSIKATNILLLINKSTMFCMLIILLIKISIGLKDVDNK